MAHERFHHARSTSGWSNCLAQVGLSDQWAIPMRFVAAEAGFFTPLPFFGLADMSGGLFLAYTIDGGAWSTEQQRGGRAGRKSEVGAKSQMKLQNETMSGEWAQAEEEKKSRRAAGGL